MQREQLEWRDDPNDAWPRSHERREILCGDVVFASAEEQAQRYTELLGAGALVVTVPPATAEIRGRLQTVLEELIERELARLGAPSPYIAAWSSMPEDAHARLSDQLFRARTIGAIGLAIVLGSLRAIASPSFTPEDSDALRSLAEATRDAPLVLLLDDGDRILPAYAAPQPLGTLLATSDASGAPTTLRHPTASSAELADLSLSEEEAASVELVGDEATAHDTRVDVVDPEPAEPAGHSPTVESGREQEKRHAANSHANDALYATYTTAPDAPSAELGAAAPHHVNAAPPPADESISRAAPVMAEPKARTVRSESRRRASAPAARFADEPARSAEAASSPREEHRPTRPTVSDAQKRERRGVSAGVPVSGPNDAWRSWAIALSSTRGAQPLAAFERLFAESYVPLANAIAAGLDDPRALRAYDEFRRSFERSYTDAFATFGATNRRPRLVMDAYDIAFKHARLSNARSSHVLLVDSMRFDLGCLVRDELAREAAGVATLTAETLLWSALPTTTMRQIETLARGLDALRAPAYEEPVESLRGRAAEVVRRLRAGSRELYKIDLVPAMLEGTTDVLGSFENIASATATAIARHITTLPPRTLLFLVGDHGFNLDRRGEIHMGGSSPEEVLVPAFSWLIGDLH